jgi:hypothetical protein
MERSCPLTMAGRLFERNWHIQKFCKLTAWDFLERGEIGTRLVVVQERYGSEHW